jgi:hypothetical protein
MAGPSDDRAGPRGDGDSDGGDDDGDGDRTVVDQDVTGADDEGTPGPRFDDALGRDGRGETDGSGHGDGRVDLPADADDETMWTFGLDDDALDDDDGLPRPPLEPERISPENALFVLLGAVLTVLIIVGTL